MGVLDSSQRELARSDARAGMVVAFRNVAFPPRLHADRSSCSHRHDCGDHRHRRARDLARSRSGQPHGMSQQSSPAWSRGKSPSRRDRQDATLFRASQRWRIRQLVLFLAALRREGSAAALKGPRSPWRRQHPLSRSDVPFRSVGEPRTFFQQDELSCQLVCVHGRFQGLLRPCSNVRQSD